MCCGSALPPLPISQIRYIKLCMGSKSNHSLASGKVNHWKVDAEVLFIASRHTTDDTRCNYGLSFDNLTMPFFGRPPMTDISRDSRQVVSHSHPGLGAQRRAQSLLSV